jgi:hypothetical protein
MPNIKRYPGVRPFETDDQDLFFGRDRDIDDLSDLIALERLVVLFGKSGYGKSSLINAGIIPKLQDIGEADDALMLPIVVRLYSYDNATASPIDKILAQLSKIADKVDSTDFLDTLSPEQPLWYHFKRRQTPTKRRFLLIFDQFEEFFTYPLAQQAAFKTQLAELLYQDTPQIVRESATTLSKDQRRFLAQALEVKVLFSIRADRMSQLDSMKDKLPAILQKRYELKGLTEEQARQAIEKPASAAGVNASDGVTSSHPVTTTSFASPTFTYSHEALRVMTQKLSETKVAQRSGIEAFQLQILCEYLEDKIIKGEIPNNCIEPQHFADNINDIYEGYYQRLIDKLDPSVRKAAQLLIEEDLIYHNEKTGDSRRESRDSGRLLDKEGITQKLLNDLESNFLLRREVNSLGGVSYEVSHDTLIAPILASKEERKALEKAEAERREAQKKQRRLLGILLATVLALAVVIGVVVYVLKLRNDAINEKNKAEKALIIAKTAQEKAEKALEDKEIAEFNDVLRRTQSILSRATNCPDSEMIKAIDSMKVKYPKNTKLQNDIQSIDSQLARCR